MSMLWAEQSWTRQRRGLRLFEVALVIGLISILVLVILHRLEDLHSKAEGMAAQGVIKSLQGAVLMHTGTGKDAPVRGPGSNPMELMEHFPGNYLGELDDVQPEKNKRGQWYFNTEKKKLIYQVDKTKRIRFSLRSKKSIKTNLQHVLACGPVLCLAVDDEYLW